MKRNARVTWGPAEWRLLTCVTCLALLFFGFLILLPGCESFERAQQKKQEDALFGAFAKHQRTTPHPWGN